MLTRLLRSAGLMLVAAIPSVAGVAAAAGPDVGSVPASESVLEAQTVETDGKTASESAGHVQVMLSGVVVDSSGSPIAGARVTILGPDSADALTDDSGRFDVWGSDAGTLTLVVEKQAGSEALHAVRTVPMSASEQHHEIGLVTLGSTCEPAWTPGLFPGPPGLDSAVTALTTFDDGSGAGPALYAGGYFTSAGGVPASRIAKWNGSSWSALGMGMSGMVRALTVFDDGSGGGPSLYAGGDFTTAGDVTVDGIAKWDGLSWKPLGTGTSLWGKEGGTVYALSVFDDGSGDGPALYAGGIFDAAGGVTVNGIAKWNGVEWAALGTGTGYLEIFGLVYAITVFDDNSGGGPALYAGGEFTTAGGVKANNIAKWDGSEWTALGTGIDGLVVSLAVFDDGSGGGPALYAGGAFTTAGGVTANHIAKWNGSTWSSLGTGLNGDFSVFVSSLAVFDDGSAGGPALYAGGRFDVAGGAVAVGIAKWNGFSWSALGTGIGGSVAALAVFDDGSGGGSALFTGGDIYTVGGVPANNIAKWNGTAWLRLGTGIDGSVVSLTVFDDGSGGGSALYAGGEFVTAGGVVVSRIAKWNGSTWSSLGTGLNNVVSALAVFDDGSGGGPALYAGGYFTSAGGLAVNNIAKWDGSEWTALGTGINDFVAALAIFDDGSGGGPALYAVGDFTTAGGVTAKGIAKWNGSTWSSLGTGLNGDFVFVSALAVFDDGSGGGPALYAGGRFDVAGGAVAVGIAKWNGFSWSALGTGIGGSVAALAVFDDGSGGGSALFTGGDIYTVGGVPANNIAKWNGTAWLRLGTGIDGSVVSLTVFDDGSGGGSALYAGGEFVTAGGVVVSRIAKWNGSTWSSLGTGLNNVVSALAVFDDGSGGGPALYAGGYFTSAGGLAVNNIAKWDGSEWTALGTGINDFVAALAIFDDGSGGGPALYAVGDFTTAGGVTAKGIAKWNGSTWSSLGTGLNGDFVFVNALAVFDDGSGGGPALYAGGYFTSAGGLAVNNIAKWDGSTWSPVGEGLSGFYGIAYDLTVFDDGSGAGPALYAAGHFTIAGGVTANNIAKWDGSEWTALGTGIDGIVISLTVFDDGSGGGPALYAGGEFASAGGLAVNNIAKWDGFAWTPLGSGISGGRYPLVSALTAFDDDSGVGPALYAGGQFTIAGGQPTGYLARWTGCPAAPAPCPGDADGSGLVNFDDMTTVLANFGNTTTAYGLGDADGSGLVNFDDLTTVLANFGTVCAP